MIFVLNLLKFMPEDLKKNKKNPPCTVLSCSINSYCGNHIYLKFLYILYNEENWKVLSALRVDYVCCQMIYLAFTKIM